jgi:chromosome partitioning protein
LPLRKSGYHAYYTHCLISFVNDGLSARADDDFLNLTANCFYTVSLKGNEVESMAVVAIASHKGGVSKTTLAILLGAEFALDGYRVTVLDCDLNQHASAFGLKAKLPNFSVVPDIGEKEVLKALRTAEDDKDIVLIDLPGGSSTLGLKAISRSHFVLVPMRPSLPDARDAMKTVAQIDDAEELARVPIPRALVWTLFRAGFESKVSRHVRTSLEGEGVAILKSALMERAAFQAIHLTGKVPRQVEPSGAAAGNVTALAQEIMEWLKIREEAA